MKVLHFPHRSEHRIKATSSARAKHNWSRLLFTYYTDLRTSSLCRSLKTETSNQQTWSTNQVQPDVETMQARAVDRSAKFQHCALSACGSEETVVVRFAGRCGSFRRIVVRFSPCAVVPFAGYCSLFFRRTLWFLSVGIVVLFAAHNGSHHRAL